MPLSRKANTETKVKVRGRQRRKDYRGGVFTAPIVVHMHTYIHTDMHTCLCEQLRKLSRDAECLQAVRKLSGFQRVRTSQGRGWKRLDRRLKCRFRATLEPRKHLSPLARITSTPSLLFPLSLLLRFTFSPILDLWHPPFLILLALMSFVPLAMVLCLPIYLALRGSL